MSAVTVSAVAVAAAAVAAVALAAAVAAVVAAAPAPPAAPTMKRRVTNTSRGRNKRHDNARRHLSLTVTRRAARVTTVLVTNQDEPGVTCLLLVPRASDTCRGS